MKHIIIINPKAGVNNEPAKIKENVEKNFVGLEYEIYFTKGPKDATNFVITYQIIMMKSDFIHVVEMEH